MPDIPPQIEGFVNRPGRTWDPVERRRFIEWLIAQCGPWLRAVVARCFRKYAGRAVQPDEARDIVADFFTVVIYRIFEGWDPAHPNASSIFGYIYTALCREARDAARKIVRRDHREQSLERSGDEDAKGPVTADISDTAAESPEQSSLRKERAQRLRDCIERLPPRTRRVVTLYLADLTNVEIAKRLGMEPNAVNQTLHRARAILKRCLEEPSEPREKVTRREIPVGTLIVGGGIMGLVLLHELSRRSSHESVILLESGSLGSEQTCHSHVYIHQGHLYADGQRVPRLRESRRFWDNLCQLPGIRQVSTSSLFGFSRESDAEGRSSLWAGLDLPYEVVPPALFPPIFTDGDIRVVYRSPEYGLIGDSVIKALCSARVGDGTVADRIGRVVEISGVEIDRTRRRVVALDAELPGGSVTFKPQAIVFAAGAGNTALLGMLKAAAGKLTLDFESQGRADRRTENGPQQIRQSHMLLIKGHKHKLPQLTGVFQLTRRLFIVSRVTGDTVVWLVSDDVGPTLDAPGDAKRYNEKWWLPGVMQSLGELAPRLFGKRPRLRPPDEFEWGIYCAQKAEGRWTGDGLPPEEIVMNVLSNTWAVWPTKLTLAPVATSTLLNEIRCVSEVALTGQGTWANVRGQVDVARERWERTATWSGWMGFEDRYGPF